MEQSNNVHLRWNKHQTTLVAVFDALLDSEKLTDCTISAEGRHLRAHKIILSACSPYFEELFIGNYEKHPIIILHDVKYNTLKALMDFMYRGEVDVPQEELSGVLKLSESLCVRGLSGSGCADGVNKWKDSGRNTPPVPPETRPSGPGSASCFTSGQNEPDGKVKSFLERSSTASSQEGRSVEAVTIAKSIQKYKKSSNHSGSDKGASQNFFKEVFTPDLDILHQLPSKRQVLTTTLNTIDGVVYSQSSHQSACRELQSASGEMAVTEKEQSLIQAAVLPDRRSANLSAYQQEVSQEMKAEVLESHTEVVEDLTLDDGDDDDDDYRGADDCRSGCNSAEVDIGEFSRVSESFGYEENFRTQEINNQHSPFGSGYLNDMTLTPSQPVLHKRFHCNFCGKSYQYLHGLQRHMKLECGKEPQFQCPHCHYRCARSYTLKTHMATRRCQMQKKYALHDV